MTPAAIISGDSQLRSNDRTCEVSVVPTLAPSMTASAIDSEISPRPAKEASSSAVAVLDCSNAGQAEAAGKGGETVLRAGADHPAQCGAKGARQAGADHAHAPQQQGNAADDVQDGVDAMHDFRNLRLVGC